MDELKAACDDFLTNHYRSKQAWFDNNYQLLVSLKEKYGGLGFIVSFMNEHGVKITTRELSIFIHKSKKKLGCLKKEGKKNQNQIKDNLVKKEKPVTDLSVFDDYPHIWKGTKEKLSAHGYRPNDFKRIGIEGITDGSTIDRKVDQAISAKEKEQGSQFASQFFTK